MSILQGLFEHAKYLKFTEWSMDREQDSEFPDPHVYFQCNFWIPIDHINEDDWDQLDNGFMDPVTGTRFYNHNSDMDDEDHYGSFVIYAHGSDIPFTLDILNREIQDMRDWLTTLSGRDNPKT